MAGNQDGLWREPSSLARQGEAQDLPPPSTTPATPKATDNPATELVSRGAAPPPASSTTPNPDTAPLSGWSTDMAVMASEATLVLRRREVGAAWNN